MHVAKFDGLVPASFDYPVYDEDETEHIEKIRLGIHRLSLDDAMSQELRDALDTADQDQKPISQFLGGRTPEECKEDEKPLKPLIGRWNLYEDAKETKLMPITWQFIASRPIDFVVALAETAINAIVPNPQKAERSRSGSAATERSETAEAAAAKS